LAVADLLGPGATVIAVDRDARALAENRRAMAGSFPETRLVTLVADFRDALAVAPLDGLVAANSLHFVRRDEQAAIMSALAARLKPGAPFAVVEYDADRGNPWVPHPFSATAWPGLAHAAGLVDARETGRVPSRFLGAIYSAIAYRPRE
jgi:SAM-dependent methyltransferase